MATISRIWWYMISSHYIFLCLLGCTVYPIYTLVCYNYLDSTEGDILTSLNQGRTKSISMPLQVTGNTSIVMFRSVIYNLRVLWPKQHDLWNELRLEFVPSERPIYNKEHMQYYRNLWILPAQKKCKVEDEAGVPNKPECMLTQCSYRSCRYNFLYLLLCQAKLHLENHSTAYFSFPSDNCVIR